MGAKKRVRKMLDAECDFLATDGVQAEGKPMLKFCELEPGARICLW